MTGRIFRMQVNSKTRPHHESELWRANDLTFRRQDGSAPTVEAGQRKHNIHNPQSEHGMTSDVGEATRWARPPRIK